MRSEVRVEKLCCIPLGKPGRVTLPVVMIGSDGKCVELTGESYSPETEGLVEQRWDICVRLRQKGECPEGLKLPESFQRRSF
jgi:hypothetical protein